jgi:ClpP class serine protease
MSEDLIIQKINEEKRQGSATRQPYYEKLERELGAPIIALFTSFVYPVIIDDSDADMLEEILQKTDLSNGFYLLLSSPGGDSLAAERIINVCRAYSDTEKYSVIVPSKAKSAATMICLGASEILMGKTSELGPVDPQLIMGDRWFSVFNIIKSYEELFAAAVKEEGNLQPYLQQLANYDAREIEEFRSALDLSKDISIKVLKTGMFKGKTERSIESKIRLFLTPKDVKVHARPIYVHDILSCGLNINLQDIKSHLWNLIYELYVRLNHYVSTFQRGKCVESKDYSFYAAARLEE